MNRRQLMIAPAILALWSDHLYKAVASGLTSKQKAEQLVNTLNGIYQMAERQTVTMTLEVLLIGADTESAVRTASKLQETVPLNQRIFLNVLGLEDVTDRVIRGRTRMAVLYSPKNPKPANLAGLDMSLVAVANRLGWSVGSLWFAYPDFGLPTQ